MVNGFMRKILSEPFPWYAQQEQTESHATHAIDHRAWNPNLKDYPIQYPDYWVYLSIDIGIKRWVDPMKPVPCLDNLGLCVNWEQKLQANVFDSKQGSINWNGVL